VRIRARRAGTHLELAVENAVDPDGSRRRGTGTGLANVRRRLEALYGAEATLAVGAAPGGLFRVLVTLPAEGGVGTGAQAAEGGSAAS
jgi:LytS/YehU family sensor histidine kinase